jgi:hypothetical protein
MNSVLNSSFVWSLNPKWDLFRFWVQVPSLLLVVFALSPLGFVMTFVAVAACKVVVASFSEADWDDDTVFFSFSLLMSSSVGAPESASMIVEWSGPRSLRTVFPLFDGWF